MMKTIPIRLFITGKPKYFLMLLLICFLAACAKEELPKNGNYTYVNFVHAGEAVLYGTNENLNWHNCLYINDSLNNAPFDNYNNRVNYPFTFDFQFDNPSYVSRLPKSFSHLGGGTVLAGGSADVYWLGMEAGSYEFIFTSKNKTYLLTKQFSLEKQTYNMLYLVESPETEASYDIVSAPIIRPEKKEGVMGIQFVNLSPDAGAVDIIRVDAEEKESSVLQKLDFKENGYAELSMSGTENTYKKMLFLVKGSNIDPMAFTVPANSGAVYTVMLRGFNKQTLRKVKIDNNKEASVTVQPNFRASSLRVFY